TSLTGLAPATINFVQLDLQDLQISGGSGGNTFTVSSTPVQIVTTLNSGTGSDTVNVLATGTASSLTINGQNGNDIVTLGNAGNAQGLLGVISVTNAAGKTSLR